MTVMRGLEGLVLSISTSLILTSPISYIFNCAINARNIIIQSFTFPLNILIRNGKIKNKTGFVALWTSANLNFGIFLFIQVWTRIEILSLFHFQYDLTVTFLQFLLKTQLYSSYCESLCKCNRCYFNTCLKYKHRQVDLIWRQKRMILLQMKRSPVFLAAFFAECYK